MKDKELKIRDYQEKIAAIENSWIENLSIDVKELQKIKAQRDSAKSKDNQRNVDNTCFNLLMYLLDKHPNLVEQFYKEFKDIDVQPVVKGNFLLKNIDGFIKLSKFFCETNKNCSKDLNRFFVNLLLEQPSETQPIIRNLRNVFVKPILSTITTEILLNGKTPFLDETFDLLMDLIKKTESVQQKENRVEMLAVFKYCKDALANVKKQERLKVFNVFASYHEILKDYESAFVKQEFFKKEFKVAEKDEVIITYSLSMIRMIALDAPMGFSANYPVFLYFFNQALEEFNTTVDNKIEVQELIDVAKEDGVSLITFKMPKYYYPIVDNFMMNECSRIIEIADYNFDEIKQKLRVVNLQEQMTEGKKKVIRKI